MTKRIGITIGALALALAVANGATAKEIQGVQLPDTATVDGTTLKLNGAGVRTAYIFVKVYVAGLYLQNPTHDAKVAVESDQIKRMELHFLREVSHDEMNDAMKNGFANTAPNTLTSEKQTFSSYLTEPFKTGAVMEIEYLPAKGTTVRIGGQTKGTIAGTDFMRALLGIWLGPKPADDSLKEGLLGEG